MVNMSSNRINPGDEENSEFGLQVKVADHKAGFESAVAQQEAETGKDLRRRPRQERDIPKESLAARIGKSR